SPRRVLWLDFCSRVTNGNVFPSCLRIVPSPVVRRLIDDEFSMEFSGSCEAVRHGGIFPRNSESGKPSGDCSINGTPMARWTKHWLACAAPRSQCVRLALDCG